MFTHAELTDAVRTVGRTGEPFTSAALRAHLGMTTQDRRTLTRFNDTLRDYCKARPEILLRLGKNRYGLIEQRDVEEERPRLPRNITIRIVRSCAAEAPPPPRPTLWTWLAKLLRPAPRLVRESR